MSETAKVGFTMAARGLVNESCSSWLLPRLIGAGRANELVFTGRVFRAADAEIHVSPRGKFLCPFPRPKKPPQKKAPPLTLPPPHRSLRCSNRFSKKSANVAGPLVF